MPDVGQLFMSCRLEDVIYLSWEVILPKFIKAVVKEFGILCVVIEANVLFGVYAATVVSEPNIVTGSGNLKRQRVVRI